MQNENSFTNKRFLLTPKINRIVFQFTFIIQHLLFFIEFKFVIKQLYKFKIRSIRQVSIFNKE